jgi:hypothetical protein
MAFRSGEVNGADQRRMAMAIPVAVVLGFACAFYIYVAIRWYLEVLLIRREAKRSSSAMVHLFASAPDDGLVSSAGRGNLVYAGDNSIPRAVYGSRDVLVMNRERARKQDKRVVA